MRRKRSFFEKITGTVNLDDNIDRFEDELQIDAATQKAAAEEKTHSNDEEEHAIYNTSLTPEKEDDVGQLAVDVRESTREIVVQAMVAGVKPSDLHIDISYDSVTVHGVRERDRGSEDDHYHHNELFWGSFSRSIVLPAEIEIETARASEKHGLLTLHLPKIDKQKKIRVDVVNNQ